MIPNPGAKYGGYIFAAHVLPETEQLWAPQTPDIFP